MGGMAIMQCVEATLIETVATDYTAGIVDFMSLEINAGRLAIAGTFSTVVAFVLVDMDFQP
jgi:hypothetical protein